MKRKSRTQAEAKPSKSSARPSAKPAPKAESTTSSTPPSQGSAASPEQLPPWAQRLLGNLNRNALAGAETP